MQQVGKVDTLTTEGNPGKRCKDIYTAEYKIDVDHEARGQCCTIPSIFPPITILSHPVSTTLPPSYISPSLSLSPLPSPPLPVSSSPPPSPSLSPINHPPLYLYPSLPPSHPFPSLPISYPSSVPLQQPPPVHPSLQNSFHTIMLRHQALAANSHDGFFVSIQPAMFSCATTNKRHPSHYQVWIRHTAIATSISLSMRLNGSLFIDQPRFSYLTGL